MSFNNDVLCNIFQRKSLNITETKKLVSKYCQYFQYTSKNKKNSDLGLEVMRRIKLFQFKQHCS